MSTTDEVLQAIDFSEIKTGTDFEIFVRDLLSCMGYQILIPPGVGGDRGKDLIVAETLEGRLSTKTVKYLVSCKHRKPGKSVTPDDERDDFRGKVEKFDCHAFLAVYSTFCSESLVQNMEGARRARNNGELFDIVVLDGAAIRKQLLELPEGPRLVRQYFPRAHLAYLRATTESFLYKKRPIFRCAECRKDILHEFDGAIVYEATHGPLDTASWKVENAERHRYKVFDIRPYCGSHVPDKRDLPNASWIRSIQDLITPTGFNDLIHDDVKFMYFWPPYIMSQTVYRKWTHLTHGLFYFVARSRPRHLPEDSRALLPTSPFKDIQWEL